MSRLRILLADDDPIICVLLMEILDWLGHEVCAIEATEAGVIGAARRHRPDLLIVDAQLADGSGVRAIREILHTGHVPYLLMSGAPVRAPTPEGVVLEKPFWNDDLLQGIERALTLDMPGAAGTLCQ